MAKLVTFVLLYLAFLGCKCQRPIKFPLYFIDETHQKRSRKYSNCFCTEQLGCGMAARAIAFGISVLPNVNIHGTMGRFWSRCTPNFTRFLHEHGLTVSNAIPLSSEHSDGRIGELL
jgi:hypothetical protein